MYDIALYGHLVFDTIIDMGNLRHDVGGIANVWKSLKSIDQSLSVYVCPAAIGTSVITIDREASQRTSNSYLNQNSVQFFVQPSTFSHIAYINELDYADFVNDLQGTVFADVCTGRKLDSRFNECIDYLFVSEEDISLVDIDNFKGKIVMHSPTKSSVGSFQHENPNDYIKNANVLGAGDHFAACFMYAKLNNRTDEAALTLSHTLTTRWLKEKNET